MNKLTFEEGYKEFEINNDPDRVLRFNPTDVGLVQRIEKELKKMGTYVGKHDNDEDGFELAKEMDAELRKHIDDIFYEGASNIIFASQNVLTTINGVTIFERFFKALLEVMKPYVEKESKKTAEKFKQYKQAHDRITTEVANNQ